MAEQTRRDRARETSSRTYTMALRASAAAVVLVMFAGLAYLVSIDQLDGGALLLYAGVLLGYIMNAIWSRQ
ncbi:hypothetical protein GJ629_03720 [Halapricum sp. CBA1109]|uniref:hypothetical protein n=1 Tax=Halapricum sp. CBA1109 TaxID=2668068 RepID=UPI0012F97E28|nr:hypothetical protein [Halapricum sp. CBA1109]MUV89120.1 hypothetical protein [Halapricum sp. CBA1109]